VKNSRVRKTDIKTSIAGIHKTIFYDRDGSPVSLSLGFLIVVQRLFLKNLIIIFNGFQRTLSGNVFRNTHIYMCIIDRPHFRVLKALIMYDFNV